MCDLLYLYGFDMHMHMHVTCMLLASPMVKLCLLLGYG